MRSIAKNLKCKFNGYYLIEVAAPQGYVLDSTPVYFDVNEDSAVKEDAVFVIEVVKANMAQKGTTQITKTDEVFSTVTENGGIYQPVYEVQGLTGCIGYLRADIRADGQGFVKTWKSHRQSLDTEEFQQKFESVLNALAKDRQYGAFLKSGADLGGLCTEHPESSFNDGFAFGFWVDTAQYNLRPPRNFRAVSHVLRRGRKPS